MKFLLILIILSLGHLYAQELNPFLGTSQFWNRKQCDCTCIRDSKLSQTEMDSLRIEIIQLEREFQPINVSKILSTNIDSNEVYIRTYETLYQHRVEFNNEVREQYCVELDSTQIRLREIIKQYKGISYKLNNFSSYLVAEEYDHYIGNSTITTIQKVYYRKSKSEPVQKAPTNP